MNSLVLELQRDALDKSVDTVDLLRKALVVARKLKVSDIVEWLNNELNGYTESAEVPEYRRLRGELKVHNPYNGWIPLRMPSDKLAEALSKRGTSQSISELEKIANSDADTVYMKLPFETEQRLMKGMEFPMEPAIFLSRTQVHGLVDRVRNATLEWALQLEEQGILGEGMSFSIEEQRQAGNVTLHVGTLGNFVGAMHGSQVQQGTTNSTQSYSQGLDVKAVTTIVADLRAAISSASIEREQRDQVESDLTCVESQLAAPKPNATVIRESLRSTRAILEGVASSAAFQGIVNAITSLGL